MSALHTQTLKRREARNRSRFNRQLSLRSKCERAEALREASELHFLGGLRASRPLEAERSELPERREVDGGGVFVFIVAFVDGKCEGEGLERGKAPKILG